MALTRPLLLVCLVIALLALSTPATAFGAGNIASIAKVEGHNWRHGDIEDLSDLLISAKPMLKTVACLKGHKWSSMMIKRVYFGNWLRDYSQAIDVGTLKGVNKEAIRLLLWVLSFMSFGFATAEFEVTDERLGCYRPEEHIDNPKDYADNIDARQYDPRLRPPVSPRELEIDPATGMKNYIANEAGGWATSSGYVKHSFARSIHFGRLYTNGARGTSGREEDLCEALRCLGQGLHCLEDFGAHTNYVELALRDLDPKFRDVFAHVGTSSQIELRGKLVYPLVTGTFGVVDFCHSVLGEATDHVTQTEIEELDKTLGDSATKRQNGSQDVSGLTDLLANVPGTGSLCREAVNLQSAAEEQAMRNAQRAEPNSSQYGQRSQPTYTATGPAGVANLTAPNAGFDIQATIAKVYPILEFRDKVVKALSKVVSTIPGFEKLIETISEKVTLFVMGILAPYIQPIIEMASQQLKVGSSTVISASGQHQYGPWEDPRCTDPTHSLLSKDHFSNVLNEPAGQVATSILQYVAPRIVYGWDHPDVPVEQILDDVVQVFHHPANRQPIALHQSMFRVVERWSRSLPDGGNSINHLLSSDSVRNGGNHKGGSPHSHGTNNTVGSTGPSNPFNLQGSSREVSDTSFRPEAGGSGYGAYEQGYVAPAPAGFRPNDPYAYPTAYQQGYEIPRSDEYPEQQANTSQYGFNEDMSGRGYNDADSARWRR